jgi:hypothetical protein
MEFPESVLNPAPKEWNPPPILESHIADGIMTESEEQVCRLQY